MRIMHPLNLFCNEVFSLDCIQEYAIQKNGMILIIHDYILIVAFGKIAGEDGLFRG
jgi:hypothetical protein